jgi:hypothetical protein
VDGLAAFLNEAPDHSVSQYFQGLGRFHERGMPTKLSATRKLSLEKHPDILKLQEQVFEADDVLAKDAATKALRSLREQLHKAELKSYKEEWLRERRDWKILTRGKIPLPHDLDKAGQIVDLIPERQRIAKQMPLKTPLTGSDMLLAIQDLCTLCINDFSVVYYPGEGPLDGNCRFCQSPMEKYVGVPWREMDVVLTTKISPALSKQTRPYLLQKIPIKAAQGKAI